MQSRVANTHTHTTRQCILPPSFPFSLPLALSSPPSGRVHGREERERGREGEGEAQGEHKNSKFVYVYLTKYWMQFHIISSMN